MIINVKGISHSIYYALEIYFEVFFSGVSIKFIMYMNNFPLFIQTNDDT